MKLALALILASCYAKSFNMTCFEEYKILVSVPTNSSAPQKYKEMYEYSGILINNLGSYYSCNKLDDARYVVFFIAGGNIVKTMCGPKSCGVEEYAIITPTRAYFPLKYQEDHYSSFTSSSIIMLTICSILGALGITATILDYALKTEQKKTLELCIFYVFQ